MSVAGSRMVCGGCGFVAPAAEPLPVRCPNAGKGDGDHVLAARLDLAAPVDRGDEDNPFVRYRRLQHSWRFAVAMGMADADYVQLVADLDARIGEVDGRGFRITDYRYCDGIDAWIKDEASHVGGSHKARHLMGIAIHLEVVDALGLRDTRQAPLAIASCGNAALAAAVVARAADRALEVFVPSWADSTVVKRLEQLEASITVCERGADDPPGDPCYHAFRRAVAGGHHPFSVQGTDNGLALEGGRTLAYEIAEQHAAAEASPLGQLFVQVGGGALMSSIIAGFGHAREFGWIGHVPRFHAVQTAGGHPLERAWRLAVAARARGIDAVADGGKNRSRYMWPWEVAPHSIASGVLDDETYDWLAIVAGLFDSNGSAVVVDDYTVGQARRDGQREAGIRVSATGAVGLAGLMVARAAGDTKLDGPSAVLFTGVER